MQCRVSDKWASMRPSFSAPRFASPGSAATRLTCPPGSGGKEPDAAPRRLASRCLLVHRRKAHARLVPLAFARPMLPALVAQVVVASFAPPTHRMDDLPASITRCLPLSQALCGDHGRLQGVLIWAQSNVAKHRQHDRPWRSSPRFCTRLRTSAHLSRAERRSEEKGGRQEGKRGRRMLQRRRRTAGSGRQQKGAQVRVEEREGGFG